MRVCVCEDTPACPLLGFNSEWLFALAVAAITHLAQIPEEASTNQHTQTSNGVSRKHSVKMCTEGSYMQLKSCFIQRKSIGHTHTIYVSHTELLGLLIDGETLHYFFTLFFYIQPQAAGHNHQTLWRTTVS